MESRVRRIELILIVVVDGERVGFKNENTSPTTHFFFFTGTCGQFALSKDMTENRHVALKYLDEIRDVRFRSHF